MKHYVIFIFTLLLVTLGGCMRAEEQNMDYTQRIVIEGRIEQGGNAMVMLSLNKEYVEDFDQDEFGEMIVRWAKVTVSDSKRSEVLTGRYSSDYPTKFIYTGIDITGREGETYTLKVEYSDYVWTATTTIPPATELVNIRREWTCDSLYRLRAELPASVDAKACIIECALDESNYYRPTLMGVIGREDSHSSRTVTINRPLDYMNIITYTTLFHRDEVVKIRVCAMSDFGYEYWSSWENINVNSLNPIFPVENNPPTNLSGGALGIWCGYGASYYYLPKEKSLSNLSEE